MLSSGGRLVHGLVRIRISSRQAAKIAKVGAARRAGQPSLIFSNRSRYRYILHFSAPPFFCLILILFWFVLCVLRAFARVTSFVFEPWFILSWFAALLRPSVVPLLRRPCNLGRGASEPLIPSFRPCRRRKDLGQNRTGLGDFAVSQGWMHKEHQTGLAQ